MVLIVLVMGVVLLGTANHLAVQRVLDLALNLHGHGLVHLVADHTPGQRACRILYLRSCLSRLFTDQRAYARNILAHFAQLVHFGALLGGNLHAQAKLGAQQFHHLLVQLFS